MLELLEKDYQTTHIRRGRNSKLSLKDKLLLTLQYCREYPTMLSLAVHYGIGETTVRNIIHYTEKVLVRSKEFALPGKKRLLEANNDLDFIIVDSIDSPIQWAKKITTQVSGKSTHLKHKS